MAENEKSLSIRFGADTSPLTEGIAKAKQKLAEYNTALIENKQKTSDTAKELKKLYKEQEKLSQEIEKSGEATDEQKAKMQALNEKIAQTTANLGQLKAAESDIKAEIKAASDELQNQKSGFDNANLSIDEMREHLQKLLEQEKELSASMKNGGTDKQNERLYKLKEKISQTYKELEKLRNKENELKSNLQAANAEFEEQTTVITSNSTKIKELKTELQGYISKQKSLAAETKNGATEEQKVQMQGLKEKISQTLTEIDRLSNEEKQLDNAVDEANKELDGQRKKLDDNSKSAGILQKALDKLGTAAKAFIGIYGAKKLWELLIGSNEEMEQYRTSFEVMLGDTEKAKALITDIQNFAAKTPLSKSDSVSIGSLLMNYGVEADEVIDKMTKLGDLAGGNAEKMNRIALAYGQMLAKGKVTGEELRQMTEAGVPLQNALAESIGVTGEELSKMVSKGKVGIDDLDKAIEGLTTGNGKFAGMMEKQSQTMQGMLSTLQDNVSEFFRQMGEGAFGEVKNVLAELMAQLDEWEKDGTLQEWAEKLGVTLKTLMQILKGAIEMLFEFGDVIVTVVAGKIVYSSLDKLTKKFSEIKNKLSELGIKGVAGTVKAGFSAIVSSINPVNLAASALIVILGNVISRIHEINQVTEEYEQNIASIEKASEDSVASVQAEMSALKLKVEHYETLRTAADLTAEQEAKLKDISEELQSAFGDEVDVVNEATGAYNSLSGAIEEYTEKKLLQARSQALYDEYEELAKEESRLKSELAELLGDSLPPLSADGQIIFSGADPTNAFEAFVKDLDDAERKGKIVKTNEAIDDVGKRMAAVEMQIISANDAVAAFGTSSKWPFANNALNQLAEDNEKLANACEENKKAADELVNTYEENKEAADKLADSLKNVNSAYLEQKENGKLSYDTIMSLVEAGYASCLQIDEETNSVRLNTEAYKKLAQAKIEARMTDLKMEIADIEAEYNVKLSDYTHSGIGSLYAEQIAESVNRQKEEATAVFTAEAKAELAALQDLYDNIDSYVTAEKTTSASSTKKEIDESREAIDKLTDSIKKVNSAYLEQSENGKLSYDTTMSLIDAGYASALETDKETGAVKLNTEAYKELAQAKIEARMNDLKASDITAEVTAELTALQDLYDNIGEYITADNGTSKNKNNKTDYSEGYEAYKTEADKKLELINKELAAKKELRDKTIAYLDEEIKKRKELNEDDDMQKEIDRVSAQLEYEQLDEFSRAQLEKKLKSLKEEQEEILWERDIQRQKDEADRVYEEAASSASKVQEQINNSVATVKQIIDALKDGVTNINNVINSNNTVNNSANISLANQYLTMAQITKAVRDALIGDVTILTR